MVFQTIFFLIFRLIGLQIGVEVRTNKGRIDAVVEITEGIFIFEFKMGGTAQAALAQIHGCGDALVNRHEAFPDIRNGHFDQDVYKDAHRIEQYCTHIDVPLSDYYTLLKGDPDGTWKLQNHFLPYFEKFDKSTELVNLHKQKRFKTLSKAEQTAEISKRYLAFVQTIEQDKLYHFVMAGDQTNPVLIIRSPTGTKEIKQFLGYDWSSAKGDEGIKQIEDTNGQHFTSLYDSDNERSEYLFNILKCRQMEYHNQDLGISVGCRVKSQMSTSIDCDPTLGVSIDLFKTVQSKLHWAITGQTAAEYQRPRDSHPCRKNLTQNGLATG